MGNLKFKLSSIMTFKLFLLFGFISYISTQETPPTEFAPQVTATCKAGTMNIKVIFDNSYSGVVHARDHRNSHCMTYGNGSTSVAMSLNLLARNGSEDYCGILVSHVNSDKTEERSIQLAVRVHKTLELADDKFYVITCGKTGLGRDDNSHVVLKFMENERRILETVYGREYTIRAELTKPNGTYGIKVKNCFAFNKNNTSIPLIDDRGCPVNENVISRFKANADGTFATAMIKSMFKFPNETRVHLQCDVVQCNGGCRDENISCTGDSTAYLKGNGVRTLGKTEDGLLLAATTVSVIDPSQTPYMSASCDEGGIRPTWLLWLAIALGVLFLIMLLMNIFLCTAMSCSCARTEIIEKEPSIIEEYDPYRSWHGSQYGSRYSLHGRDGHNKGYTSGGSTIHSNRSLPIDSSDHYAIVHSRPGSRHSGQVHRSRGPNQ